MKEFWDDRFGSEDYVYGTAPNEFFKEQLDKFEPGKLLLPGEGEGRNAVYAASKSWEVTAVDYSVIARKKALRLADRNDVQIDYSLMDLRYLRCRNGFDAIGLVFIHFRPEQRIAFHHHLIDCLKKGGIIIAEFFHKRQLENKTGGPPAIEMLYDEKELRDDFRSLRIGLLEEKKVHLTEGSYHKGIADVVRLVAKKD